MLLDSSQIVIISCAVFKHQIEDLIPAGLREQILFLDYGLHRVPSKLKESIQEIINNIDKPSTILLAYGLCGNGLDGIESNEHTILIPRADDCIAILLGSYKKYKEEFLNYPGTYYLTKGWLESGSDPLREYQDLLKRYDQNTANWIMDQQYRNYQRIVFVAHSGEDIEKYRPRALEVANYCEQWQMHYEEILGSNSYIKLLFETTTSLDDQVEDILVIQPGENINRQQFVR